MKFNSIKFKISILYTAILGFILLLYSSALYFNLSYIVYHEVDRNLRKKVEEVENTIRAYADLLESNEEEVGLSLKRTLHLEEVKEEEFFQWPVVNKVDRAWGHNMQSLGIKHDYILIISDDGKIIERSSNIEEPVLEVLGKDLGRDPPAGGVIENLLSKDLKLRTITRPFSPRGRRQYTIRLATSLTPVLFVLKSKLTVIFVTIPIVLLLTAFLGRFFVARVFKPMTEIAQTARAISHEDMSKRVEPKFADDEIRYLVDAFNNMISRLEKSFTYVEEFSSNVAHELKTSLTIIRGEAEVTLRTQRDPQEYKIAIEVMLEETKRMLKIIDDLLLLAKIDYRPQILTFEEFDLRGFIKEIYEQSKIFASEKKVSLSVALPKRPLKIRASRLHLRRLFLNLLDNAVKFTPQDGRIDIAVKREGGNAAVSISDSGIGISEADLPKIFNRFFRIDKTDQVSESSSGLGLSFVDSIAKIHQGSVEVQSQKHQGSTFTVRLPLVLTSISSRLYPAGRL